MFIKASTSVSILRLPKSAGAHDWRVGGSASPTKISRTVLPGGICWCDAPKTALSVLVGITANFILDGSF